MLYGVNIIPHMKITRLLFVLLTMAPGAFAQENPAKLALAREAIAAMQVDKMFDGIAAQMKQMAAQMAVLPPDATPEQRKKAEELQGKIMDISMGAAKGMIAKMDQIYADVYSEAELKAMRSFFTSPEGQSMLAKQPQVMARIMPLVQEMQRDLMPKIKQLGEEAKAAK
jgi:uncharacterized protein